MKILSHLLICCGMSAIFTSSLQSLTQQAEKKIVIVIPSYNNSKWYERNIESALSQNYSNFRIIYTDDCSPDNTGKLVEKYLAKHDTQKKVTLIKNPLRKGALHNLYTMIHMCDDNEIIVTLDGDDWLPDNDTLKRLNAVYSSGEIWLTFGQFKLHPSQTIGWASPMPDYIIQSNGFRDFQHLPTHLRTFYAWLFKKIKLEDLLYQGQFYPMTWDMAMMFPMIEMASERHKFIPEVMYIYNDENSISDHNVSRQLQAHLAQIIKKKIRYKRLIRKEFFQKIDNKVKTNAVVADAFIFAKNSQDLTKVLDSFKKFVRGIGHIYVVYQASLPSETEAYKKIGTLYKNVGLYPINDDKSNFHATVSEIYYKSHNRYLLFAKGDTIFNKQISLYQCATALQNTGAYAFYLKLDAQDALRDYQTMPLIECYKDIFAWNFSIGRNKWCCANSFDLVLHDKTESLARILQGKCGLTVQGLEAAWANEGQLDKIGLCFNESCTTPL